MNSGWWFHNQYKIFLKIPEIWIFEKKKKSKKKNRNIRNLPSGVSHIWLSASVYEKLTQFKTLKYCTNLPLRIKLRIYLKFFFFLKMRLGAYCRAMVNRFVDHHYYCNYFTMCFRFVGLCHTKLRKYLGAL